MSNYVLSFDAVRMSDVAKVGGKNASLGEMIGELKETGVKVPDGFATTAEAFRDFLNENELTTRIYSALDALDVEDVAALSKTGRDIRDWIVQGRLSERLCAEISAAYEQLEGHGGAEPAVAVRSSATAEDLPEASFAGQQETLLNVRGRNDVLDAVKRVFASLFTDRAITYRSHHGFDHRSVALSAGIQRMVRSDKAASGVIFTIDTESGFPHAVFITASYGLGETIVQGAVNPDEFYVDKRILSRNRPAVLRRRLGSKLVKLVYTEAGGVGSGTRLADVPDADRRSFCISDDEVQSLARQAETIEQHYKRPMDIEWAKDGVDGGLYILQARPETVKSRASATILERYELKHRGPVLTSGRSIGERIGAGPARVITEAADMSQLQDGEVLITDMTDPDWEPVMRRAAAIVTNRGGRTCHAAIVARELGVPAVVGTGDGTSVLESGQPVTVSCAEGDTGYIYEGIQEFEINRVELDHMPEVPVKIMMNVANPDLAFGFQALPNDGVGLARLEFIINRMIGIHPKALLNFDQQAPDVKASVLERSSGYSDPVTFYVEKLVEGVSTLAAAFWPKPVIVRFSDFKSNEYANLIGGASYEPHEENPMIGFRGASRYLSDAFKDCVALECRAIKKVRDVMGLTNLGVMVPFVRTLEEARGCVELLEQLGLKRGENELRLYMMCEIPSNALLAEEFLEYFDGFSIGSNDLTQLTLGLDRDSALVAGLFDERHAAVKALLSMAISACRKRGKYVGICGQGPSDEPELATWLVEQGIDSVSLNPDTVVSTWLYLAKHSGSAS